VIEPERLAFELCRIWFDDIYIVGHRYFDGLKGDFSPEGAAEFRAQFTSIELEALDRFSQFLELRLEMLPQRVRTSERIPDNDTWRNLVKDAAYLLEDLDPRTAPRSRRLAERLSEMNFSKGYDLTGLIDLAITRSEDSAQ
jgi:hypothetical protein